MIPRLQSQDAPVTVYAEFLSELRLRGFEGDISQRPADRVVFATDNSIYQVPPQAVVFPRHETDVVRVATLAVQTNAAEVQCHGELTGPSHPPATAVSQTIR